MVSGDMAKHRLNEMTDLIDGYVFMPWYNYANIEQNRFRPVGEYAGVPVIQLMDHMLPKNGSGPVV